MRRPGKEELCLACCGFLAESARPAPAMAKGRPAGLNRHLAPKPPPVIGVGHRGEPEDYAEAERSEERAFEIRGGPIDWIRLFHTFVPCVCGRLASRLLVSRFGHL
jgi:hypothetical protein